jgi:hypothetical protein
MLRLLVPAAEVRFKLDLGWDAAANSPRKKERWSWMLWKGYSSRCGLPACDKGRVSPGLLRFRGSDGGHHAAHPQSAEGWNEAGIYPIRP